MPDYNVRARCAHCGELVEFSEWGGWWRHVGRLVGPCGYRTVNEAYWSIEPTTWPAPGPRDHESQLLARGEIEWYGGGIYDEQGIAVDSKTSTYGGPDNLPTIAGGALESADAEIWAKAEIERESAEIDRAWAEFTSD